MKNLSQWANHHVRIAIFLIVLCEVINGFTGVLLGANLLGNTAQIWLYTGMILLIGNAVWIRFYSTHNSSPTGYWIERQYLLAAFLGNFLLFNLLGGIWDQRLQTTHPSVSVLGSRRVVAIRDTLPPTDTLRATSHSAADLPSNSQTSQRTNYILLGILGIGVAFLVTTLACNIACAGHGFLALLVFYLGLGSMAGSVYFFARSNQKPLKRRRDMTADERQRDSKHFWLPWVILVGIFSALFLIGSSK